MKFKTLFAHLVYIPDILVKKLQIVREPAPEPVFPPFPNLNLNFGAATARLHKDLEARQSQITNLENEIMQLRFQTEANDDMADLEDEIDQLASENGILQENLTRTKNELKETKDSLSKANLKIKDLDSKLQKEYREVCQFRQENNSLKSKCQELDCESQSMRKRLNTLKTYVENYLHLSDTSF